MNAVTQPAETFAQEFLRTFALPLVRGGKVHVGAPLGRAGLRQLQQAAPRLAGTDTAAELSAARQEIIAELLFHAPAPGLDEDPYTLPLLLAVHDLMFLLHPAAQGLLFSDRRLRRVAGFAMAVCRQAVKALKRPDGHTARLLCERHSLLHSLFTVSREDVRVSFWAGRREFLGTEPPARLLAWRSVRRVHEERWRVVWYLQMLGLPGGIGRLGIDALLAASPLTDLLMPRRLDPPFDLGKHVALLRQPAICRALCYYYLDMGLPEVGGALAGSVTNLLSTGSRGAADAQLLLRFLSHLHLCTLLRDDDPEGAQEPLLPAVGSDGALRDLYGLYGVLERDWRHLAVPPDVAFHSSGLSRRVAAYAEACLRMAGPLRIEELAVLCARTLPQPGQPKAWIERTHA